MFNSNKKLLKNIYRRKREREDSEFDEKVLTASNQLYIRYLKLFSIFFILLYFLSSKLIGFV